MFLFLSSRENVRSLEIFPFLILVLGQFVQGKTFVSDKDKTHEGFLKYWVIAIQNSFYFSTIARFIALVKRHAVQYCSPEK